MALRLIVTARPSAHTVAVTERLLTFACAVKGARMVNRGLLDPEAVAGWVDATLAGFKAALAGDPCDPAVGLMVADAIRTAGGACRCVAAGR